MKNFYVSCGIYLLCASLILADPIKDNATPTSAAPETTTTLRALGDCLAADSISCLQFTVFRKAKSIFENPQINIIDGISLVTTTTTTADGRQAKAINENVIAVETAPSVEARNIQMGNYLMDAMKRFFAERTLNVNFANVGRSVARAIPEDIKSDLRELVVESRTKKKKIMKKLMPILLGVGAKVAVLSFGALIGLFFLAKKALIVSVLAFFMALVAGAGSGFGKFGSGEGFLGGLGGLFGGKNAGAGASAGWSSGGSGGWSSNLNSGWDSHGAYSSPVGQSLAYSAYKSRR